MECLICGNQILINNFQAILALKTPIICQHCQAQVRYKKRIKNIDDCTVMTLFERNEFIESIVNQIEKGDVVLLDIFYPYIEREVFKGLEDEDFFEPVVKTSRYDGASILVERLYAYKEGNKDKRYWYDAATGWLAGLKIRNQPKRKSMKLGLVENDVIDHNCVLIYII